jgi:hypothetical protein
MSASSRAGTGSRQPVDGKQSAMAFALADPSRISARAFDDEVVIANFDTGLYYSLMGSAAAVWTGLMAGMSVAAIAETLGAPSEDGSALATAVIAFVESLETEGLIKPCELYPTGVWEPKAPAGGWAAPEFESFSDMQQLLLLDPVHDASDAGWPYVVTP